MHTLSQSCGFVNTIPVVYKKFKFGETKKFKENAKVYDEMILDVNTDYFKRHGGYKFAREFYGEAYRFACKLYGEQNILSAVIHADMDSIWP